MLHLGEYRGYDAIFPCYITYFISLALLAAGFWVTSVYIGASLGVFNCISFSSYLLFDSNLILSLQMVSHEYGFNLLYYLGFVIQLLLCGGMCYFSLYSRFVVGRCGGWSWIGSESGKGTILLCVSGFVVLLSLDSAYRCFQL